MKLDELYTLNESIEDKGIFKAVFVVGSPAAGKSYTISQINDGRIQPRIVNTDKMYEFLSKTRGVDIGKEGNPRAKRKLVDQAKHLSKSQLVHYINGMLPLFIDGTSSDASNVLRRISLLESFGYDIGLIWVSADLDVTIERARQRLRHVDEELIKNIHDIAEENVKFLRGRASHFWKIENNEGELNNDVILKAYNEVSNFFRDEIRNPVGKRTVERMRENGWKYLVPHIYSKEQIERLVGSWYVKRSR